MLAALFLPLLILVPCGALPDVDLEQGSPCQVPTEAAKVADVMDALSAAIDRPLTLLGRGSKPDEEMLAREVTLARQDGNFWQVVGALEEALGLELETLRKNEVKFRDPKERVQWLGEWQVLGVLRVRPYHQGQAGMIFVRMQAEPWLDEVDPGDRIATLRTAKNRRGKVLEPMADGHMNNDSLLDFTFDYFFDLSGLGEKDKEGTAALFMEVPIGLARSWLDAELPPFKTLQKKAHRLGKGKDKRAVELIHAKEVTDGGRQRIEVKVAILQCPLFGDGWLVGPDGTKVPRIFVGKVGDEERLEVTLRFAAEDVPGDLDDWKLVLHVPGEWVEYPLKAQFEGMPLQ